MTITRALSAIVKSANFFDACMTADRASRTICTVATQILGLTDNPNDSTRTMLAISPELAGGIRDALLNAFVASSPLYQPGLTHADVFGQFDRSRKARHYADRTSFLDAYNACPTDADRLRAFGTLGQVAARTPRDFAQAQAIFKARNTAGHAASILQRAAQTAASVPTQDADSLDAWRDACGMARTTPSPSAARTCADLVKWAVRTGRTEGLDDDAIATLVANALTADPLTADADGTDPSDEG